MVYDQEQLDEIQRDCMHRLEMARSEYKWKHDNAPPSRLEVLAMEARIMERLHRILDVLAPKETP